MATEIQPYREDRIDAVRAFNQRLRAGGIAHRFPETALSPSLPQLPGRDVYQEYFLAIDGNQVHGGYVLKRQSIALNGQIIPIGNYQFPLSEGILDRAHAALGARFVRHALRQQPLLYSLGLGGRNEAIARLLLAAGWSLEEVPFLFRPLRAAPCLRELRPLRDGRARRLAADALAATGLGAVGLFAYDQLAPAPRHDPAIACERVEAFGPWADELWQRCLLRYAMMAVRDARTLNLLYEAPRFLRLQLRRGEETVGWAVLLATQMADHKYFGALRVGTLVDCLALPEHADAIARASLEALRAAGCDLALSNQSHHVFVDALARAGFLRGPSNFLLAVSPQLATRLAPLAERRPEVHMTRGDGDGPYNL